MGLKTRSAELLMQSLGLNGRHVVRLGAFACLRLFLSMMSEGFGSTTKRTSSPLPSVSIGH
eukprot:5954950-Amphidinium_carterae.1